MLGKSAINGLLAPVLLLISGVALLALQPSLPLAATALAPYSPYGMAMVAALLGMWFKRARVALMAALGAGVYWVLQSFPVQPGSLQVGVDAGADTRLVIYAALSVMVAVNAGAIGWMRDCAMWSLAVLSRLLFIAAQVAVVAVVWGAGDVAREGANQILHYRIFEKAFDHWSLLPQPAMLIGAVILASLLVRTLVTRSAIDGGMFGALSTIFMALHGIADLDMAAMLLTLTGVVLSVAVVQDTYRMAFVDELTSLSARRALMMDMDALGNRYSVAMLDVDHFKKFNDTYGHDVGDQVLKLVASRMMRVKGGGRAYRYGGEEFTVLFAGKSADQTVAHLETLRKAIAESRFLLRADDRPKEKPQDKAKAGSPDKGGAKRRAKAHDSDEVSVTISIGVAERGDGDQPRDTLKAADEALYRAKDGGRNRVSR